MTLTLRHIRALLENSGAIPDDLRKTGWRFMLALPNDVEFFDSLVTRGIHKDAHSLPRLFPISDRRLLGRLQKICTALYYWSPDLASVSWLAQFVFPFVKFWDRDLVASFETCVILLSTYQSWLQFRDVPPNREIIFVDSISAYYTGKSGVGTERPADWAWKLFIGLFTDQLSGDEWLRFCDHWFCDGHRAFLYAALAAFPTVVPSQYLLEAMHSPYHSFSIADFLKRTKEVLGMLRRHNVSLDAVHYNDGETPSCPDLGNKGDMSLFLQSRFKLIPISGMRHMDSIVLPRMTILDYNTDLALIEREQKEFLNIMRRAHFRNLKDDPMDTCYSISTTSGTMDSEMSQHSVVSKAKQAVGVSRSGVANLRSDACAIQVESDRAKARDQATKVARNLGDAGNIPQAKSVQDSLARSAFEGKRNRVSTITCDPPTPTRTDRDLASTFTISTFRPASQRVDQSGRAVQTEDIAFIPVSTAKSQMVAEHIAREMAQEVADSDVRIREATQMIENDLRERHTPHPSVQKSHSVVYQAPVNTENGFVVNLSERERQRAASDGRNKKLIGQAVQNALLKSLTTVRNCHDHDRATKVVEHVRKPESAGPPIGQARARSTEFDLESQAAPEYCKTCDDRGVYTSTPTRTSKPMQSGPASPSTFANPTRSRPSSAKKRPQSATASATSSKMSSTKSVPKPLPSRCIETVTVDSSVQNSKRLLKGSQRSLKNTTPQLMRRSARSVTTSAVTTTKKVDKSIGVSQAKSLKGSVGVQHTSAYTTDSDTEETKELVNRVDMVLNQTKMAPRKELLELEHAPRDTLLGLIDTLDHQLTSIGTSAHNVNESTQSSNCSDLIAEKLGIDPQLNVTHPEARPMIKSIYLDDYDDEPVTASHLKAGSQTVDSVRFVPVSSKVSTSQRTTIPTNSTNSMRDHVPTSTFGYTDASNESAYSYHDQPVSHPIPLVPPHHSLHVTMPSISGTHLSEHPFTTESGSTSPYTNSDNTQKPSVSFALPDSALRETHKSILARRDALESVSLSSGAMEPMNLNVQPIPYQQQYHHEPGYPLAANEKDLTISSVQEPVLATQSQLNRQSNAYSRPQLSQNLQETTTSTFLPQPSTSIYYSTSQPVVGQQFLHSTSLPIPSRSASRTGSAPPQSIHASGQSAIRENVYPAEKSDSQITKATGVEPVCYENSNTYTATITNYDKSTGSLLHTQKNQLPVQVIVQDKDQSYTLGNKDIDTLEDSDANTFDLRTTSGDLLKSVRRKLGDFKISNDPSISSTTLDVDPSAWKPFNGLLSSVARLGDTTIDTKKDALRASKLMESEDYSALEDPIVDTDSPYRQDQTPIRPAEHSLTDLQNLTWGSAAIDPSMLDVLHAQTSPATNAIQNSIRGYCNQIDNTLSNLKQGLDNAISKAS